MQRAINITKHETQDNRAGTKHIIFDDKKKYEFWERKKDGNDTKAFAQWKMFGLSVGSSCPAEVDETPEEFTNKEGKLVKFTRRTILYWVGDEHGVPYVTTDPQKREIVIAPGEVETLKRKVKLLEDAVFGIEKAEDGINPSDLPF